MDVIYRTINSLANTQRRKSENLSELKRNKNLGIRISFYIFGFLIMTLGIAISVKSNLGVSPVSSIPYTMTCVWGIEMGKATILFHVLLVILQILILRKSFQFKNLLQIPVGILFGLFTTFSNFLMTYFPDPNLWSLKFIMIIISTFLIALGIFFYVPADIVPLAGEGTMLAVSLVTKKKFSSIKLIFDISMVTISLGVCLFFLHSTGSVGIGTIIGAVLVGTELKLITRFFGSRRDRFLHADIDQKSIGSISPLLKITKKEIYIVKEEDSFLDALKLFDQKKISGAPVVNSNGDLVGFVSDGDIMRYLSSEHSLFINSDSIEKICFNDKLKSIIDKKIIQVAKKNVVTVNFNDDLEEVCYKLSENDLKKAPVMQNGKMIGIINNSNITSYVLSLIEP